MIWPLQVLFYFLSHFFVGCNFNFGLDQDKTSMKPHLEHFRAFIKRMDEEAKLILRERRLEEEKKLNF
jgi:hypothetical protein